MEDKGKGLVVGDGENLISELEVGPSNMEIDKEEHDGDGSDDNYDDEDENSDEGGQVDDDEGDESEEGDEFEAGSEIPTTFERLEYEALAEKKRKALADSQRDGSEKRAKYDAINISNSTSGVEGFMDFFSTGRRRKSRKHKKRGRRHGSKKEVSPDILKRFREALLLHAHNRDIEALPILLEVIKQAPAFDTAYYYLSRVSEQLGRTESLSTEALKIAANIKGPKSPFWKLLYERFKEQDDMLSARSYASKAIQADPDDIPLKYEYADLCLNAGKYKDAAETYEQIFRQCPERIEALKWGTEYFLKSGEGERAASILEDHIKSHSSEVGPDVLDLLASVFMQINAYDRALKYIHDASQIYSLGKELPSSLKIRQAICHVRLEEMEQAETVLSILPREAVSEHPELITNLADELTNIGNFNSALKYYLLAMSEPVNNGYLFVKVARCYTALAKREQAIIFYYKALNELSDPVDARITLASLLLEDGKRDEAVFVLSPPENPDLDIAKQKVWWKNRKIRMNLCQIYYSEGMLEDFANTALQLVFKWVWRQTVKEKRKRSVLSEHQRNRKRRRPRDAQASQLRGGPKKWCKIRATLNETRRIRERAAMKAHNEAICSESEEEPIKDEEYHRLFVDLCKALTSLQRYWEALAIVNLGRRLDAKMLPVEIKKELQSLGAKISCDTMDPKQWFDCVRSVIHQHPYRLKAWNCYYKVISRLGKRALTEAKFMHHLRSKDRDCATDEEHELSTNGQSSTYASSSASAFSEHLSHKLSSEELESLPKSNWKFKWEAPAIDMPNCRWKGTRQNFLDGIQSDESCGLKPKLFKHWLQLYKKSGGTDFDSSKRRRFFSICNSYLDILHSNKRPFYNRGPEEDSSAMDAYLMHSLNHIFRSRDLVKKNESKIAKHRETSEQEILSDDGFLDQGFTRPKVLILLPLRSIAFRVVKRLIQLTPEAQRVNVEHLDRFTAEFGCEDDLDDGGEKTSKNGSSITQKSSKPSDWQALFGETNSDDEFMFGIKHTRKSIKLYGDFYSSDMIIASPLKLHMAIGQAEENKERDVDYLSSIEVLVIDHADIISMQNWSFLATVVDHLNRLPSKQHGTNIMRIRPLYLDGHARFYRQSIILSSYLTPEINALFNRQCLNYKGKVKLACEYKGVLEKVLLPVRQIYERFDADSMTQVDDARLEYFTKKIFPKIKDSVQGGVMIFIHSYFDFVRVRNFLKAQNASFCLLGDYTKNADISRAREWFFVGSRKIMVYTERAYFYRRYRIRGIKNLIFYSLPERKEFYPQIMNMLEGSDDMMSTALFSRFDMLKMERIVGSASANRMMGSEKSIFAFC